MKFKPRLTRPEAGNKYYIRKSSGGWSPCCEGSPLDPDCNVLANCVGYACGRFAELCGRGAVDLLIQRNGEDIFAANKDKFRTGSKPRPGAVICWAKGRVNDSSDGYGHVAVVEQVISDTEIVTSESAYNGKAFFTKTRKKGTDGRWGQKEAYSFQGFIYPPVTFEAEKPVIPAPEDVKIRPGDAVRVCEGAKDYNGGGLAAFVYAQTYTVMEIGRKNPDRIVIGQNGVITAAVRAGDLVKL